MMEAIGNGGVEHSATFDFKNRKIYCHTGTKFGIHEVSGIVFAIQSVTAATTVQSFYSGLVPHTTPPLGWLLWLGVFHPYTSQDSFVHKQEASCD